MHVVGEESFSNDYTIVKHQQRVKTTERYLHVKREELITIINPPDALFKNKSWEGGGWIGETSKK